MGPRPIRVDEVTDVWSFITAIDWEERWLQGVLLFHVLCFGLVIALRKRTNFTAFLFFILLATIYFSEWINEWCSKNYKLFSNQQYFDSHGLFISVILSGPIHVNCVIIVILSVHSTFNMMVKVKRAQLKEQAKQQQKEQEKKDS